MLFSVFSNFLYHISENAVSKDKANYELMLFVDMEKNHPDINITNLSISILLDFINITNLYSSVCKIH